MIDIKAELKELMNDLDTKYKAKQAINKEFVEVNKRNKVYKELAKQINN